MPFTIDVHHHILPDFFWRETDLKLWRHVMHVELDIVFHTTQPAWKHLMKRGGAIINTASQAATRGSRGPRRRWTRRCATSS
jgi:NAD(P)-dependent dehydrogenase (short-subunit alcohol dehydrogenase family)